MPMPTLRIDDPADPRLQSFADLPRRAAGEAAVVEGEIAVARVLDSAHPVAAVLCTPAHHARLADALPEDLPTYVAEAAVIRGVVGFDFHRGCLALVPRPAGPSPEALAEALPPGPALVLVAEGLADPANLGAVIRCARGFGAAAVLHGRGADPWSRRAIRAAMGLSFSLPVVGCDDVPGAVDRLREALGPGSRTVAAVVQPGAIPLSRYRPAARTVLMVGSEGAGRSAPLRARADDAVTIPLAERVDSLNVAAATAVLLWTLGSAAR
ncbi:MAG: RNA methyltransferase [Myxococcales bacterium]|nr:RNA methyltransferase [Myxococcales bacterium]